MKNKTLFTLILAAVLALGLAQPIHAQTILDQTFLTAAMSATATTMTVTSNTGFTASTNTVEYWAFIENEAVRINAVSGTLITVQRGQEGAQTAHPINSIVHVGLKTRFYTNDPPIGSCTRATELVIPRINVRNGNLWDCQVQTNQWVKRNYTAYAAPMLYREVNDVAYTMTLQDRFVTYITITATRILTLPSITGIVGHEVWIKHQDDGVSEITITGANGQFFQPGDAATLALTVGGGTVHLMSVRTNNDLGIGLWGWVTLQANQ